MTASVNLTFTVSGGVAVQPGTAALPYAASSPWNSYPVSPVLGSNQIPVSSNYPWLQADPTILWVGAASDPPVTITGPVPDEGASRAFTFPHVPAGAVPTAGSDHEFSVLDATSGVLTESWVTNLSTAGNTSQDISNLPITGSGWPTPAHPFVGTAAPGCPVTGGALREWERAAADAGNLGVVQHALSLTISWTSAITGPVWPAAMEDYNSSYLYSGALPNAVPMGALMMLPANFNLGSLTTNQSKAIATALMKYGAYVMNTGSNVCGYTAEGAWTNDYANLATIQASLRQVASCASWKDWNGNAIADGRPTVPTVPNLAAVNLNGNILNLQGIPNWNTQANGAQGAVTSTSTNGGGGQQYRWSGSYSPVVAGNNATAPGWWWGWQNGGWYINPTPGRQYKISVIGTTAGPGPAGGSFLCTDNSTQGLGTYFNISLNAGQSQTVTWPSNASTAFRVILGVYQNQLVTATMVGQ